MTQVFLKIYIEEMGLGSNCKIQSFDIGYILVLDKINKVYLKVDCLKYSYASNLSEFEHNKIRAAARAARQSKFDNLNLQKAKIQLIKSVKNITQEMFEEVSK